MHQRSQLLQQVTAECRRLGDGNAVGTRHLDLGIGPRGGSHFTVAVISQAQCRVAIQGALVGTRFGTVLQVSLEGLAQSPGGLFMQGRQTVDGLFGVSTTTKAWLTLGFLSGHACQPSCLPLLLNTSPMVSHGVQLGQAGVARATNASTSMPRGNAPYTRPPPLSRLPMNASLTTALPASSSSLACNAKAMSSVSCRARYWISLVSANAP